MTRPLEEPALRTANEAMRRATVVEDVYVALKALLGQWERHGWLREWAEIALQPHPDAERRQRLQRHVNDIRWVPNDWPDSPWDSTSHRMRDVTADLIDAPVHGNVLTLLRLLQDRYFSNEEVAV